jgi:hypothetical protein
MYIFNILPSLYSNIICKNIVIFFQTFEMGYTQTCTPLENSIMWHPNLKGTLVKKVENTLVKI